MPPSSSSLSIPIPAMLAPVQAQAPPTPLAWAAIGACAGAATGAFTYTALLPINAVKTRLLPAVILGSASSSAIYFGTCELAKSLLRPHLPSFLCPRSPAPAATSPPPPSWSPRSSSPSASSPTPQRDAPGRCSFRFSRQMASSGSIQPSSVLRSSPLPPAAMWFHSSPAWLGFRETGAAQAAARAEFTAADDGWIYEEEKKASGGGVGGGGAKEEGLEVAKLEILAKIIDKLAARGITRLFPIQFAYRKCI